MHQKAKTDAAPARMLPPRRAGATHGQRGRVAAAGSLHTCAAAIGRRSVASASARTCTVSPGLYSALSSTMVCGRARQRTARVGRTRRTWATQRFAMCLALAGGAHQQRRAAHERHVGGLLPRRCGRHGAQRVEAGRRRRARQSQRYGRRPARARGALPRRYGGAAARRRFQRQRKVSARGKVQSSHGPRRLA